MGAAKNNSCCIFRSLKGRLIGTTAIFFIGINVATSAELSQVQNLALWGGCSERIIKEVTVNHRDGYYDFYFTFNKGLHNNNLDIDENTWMQWARQLSMDVLMNAVSHIDNKNNILHLKDHVKHQPPAAFVNAAAAKYGEYDTATKTFRMITSFSPCSIKTSSNEDACLLAIESNKIKQSLDKFVSDANNLLNSG